jgi:hypothetical protein
MAGTEGFLSLCMARLDPDILQQACIQPGKVAPVLRGSQRGGDDTLTGRAVLHGP